jgi:hypothetical protein
MSQTPATATAVRAINIKSTSTKEPSPLLSTGQQSAMARDYDEQQGEKQNTLANAARDRSGRPIRQGSSVV